MKRGQDLVDENRIHWSFRNIDQALSKHILQSHNFSFTLNSPTVPSLEILRALDAVEDHRFKPLCLKVELEFDKVVHELELNALL